ncbi:hypothetical protein M409DRAFT_48371 [Zasmidium cellare ATCC 36951]|uniref:Cell wall hydroxyproline-rich glycoprotein n=1 Tax=Zasmidium cellare ATCC 36951 TaxID=1080233 RepID=A0A6A6D6Y3_ZASCE|nr:uncharacterized protein M409DRAFT_48371 [Zasmidium cellare ATCC 36951]KAF2173386.1 hypothetical protein M409DRAFT_48371 [Zasmidium cellare ATCC 36951]
MGPFVFKTLISSLLSSGLVTAGPTPRATWDNLARDAATLKKFGETVTSDPQGIIESWTGTDVCSWKGITCAEHPDGYQAVAGIDFNGYNLGANLRVKDLLDKLLDLTFFHANSNDFTGTVPDVSRLEYLFELDLSNNHLTGNFPLSVLSAPLTFLDLRFNELQGELPDDLFTKTDMDTIFLNDNNFSGKIPEAGNISTLYITLANNKFEGSIPASFANIEGLKEVLFLGNKLTGTVPEELCALELDVLDVSDNQLDTTLGPKCQALKDKGVLVV